VFANARVAREAGWLPFHMETVRGATDASLRQFRWSPVMRVLLRYDRPPLAPLGEGPVSDLVVGLRRHAGGALLDAAFRARAEAAICPRGLPDGEDRATDVEARAGASSGRAPGEGGVLEEESPPSSADHS
jgi:hypothetical protein